MRAGSTTRGATAPPGRAGMKRSRKSNVGTLSLESRDGSSAASPTGSPLAKRERRESVQHKICRGDGDEHVAVLATPEASSCEPRPDRGRSRSTSVEASAVGAPSRGRRGRPALGPLDVSSREISRRSSDTKEYYHAGTRKPIQGWYQRCLGCGVWTGQSVLLGSYEVYRCQRCARGFRDKARELFGASRPVTSEDPARFDTVGTIAPGARAEEDSPARVGEESLSTSASDRILSSPSSASESVDTIADDVDARPSTSGSPPDPPTRAKTLDAVPSNPVRSRHRRRRSEGDVDAVLRARGGVSPASSLTQTVNAGNAAPRIGGARGHHRRTRSDVLSGLVEKLRDYLVVAAPSNGVECSVRRCRDETDRTRSLP
jgi:hypothetical protein